MLPLQLKEGVELRGSQAVNEILAAAQVIYARFSVPCVVTSGRDGQHDEHSKHYTDNALDLRIRDFKPDDLQAVVQGLQELLGKDFVVILELIKKHIHIQKGVKGQA